MVCFASSAGSGRYRALEMLSKRGALPEDFRVPVTVRETLSRDGALRIAAVENLQRADLAPLEEAAVLGKLLRKGVALDDVAAETGLSARTIKRRLALHALCDDAKAALANGAVSLAQAEALTLGSTEQQRGILEEVLSDRLDAALIRDALLAQRPTVAMAIFPLDRYRGGITTDLFAEAETSYFDDVAEFLALQREAVKELARDKEGDAAWVEVTERHAIPAWRYGKVRKGRKGGVVINLAPSGAVDIREGLKRIALDADTVAQTEQPPLAPARERAAYSGPLCRLIAHHKTTAVQELLLSSPRKAREVLAVTLLRTLSPHKALWAFSADETAHPSYGVLDEEARRWSLALGCGDADVSVPVWHRFGLASSEPLSVYERVKTLGDPDLDRLLVFLAALPFGQENCEALDMGDTLFNHVARDLGADMRNHWRPDAAFLERRTREQLIAIGRESGFAEGRGGLAGYKKERARGRAAAAFRQGVRRSRADAASASGAGVDAGTDAVLRNGRNDELSASKETGATALVAPAEVTESASAQKRRSVKETPTTDATGQIS